MSPPPSRTCAGSRLGGLATIASRNSLSPWCRRASAYARPTAMLSRIVPPRSATVTPIAASSGVSTNVAHSSALKSALVVIGPSVRGLRHTSGYPPNERASATARRHGHTSHKGARAQRERDDEPEYREHAERLRTQLPGGPAD